jgi:flavin reductase (DIM6/NTAB) family NADH-FMN oxidoreductase RutF/DNA-binding GntR family transcriptional regulator
MSSIEIATVPHEERGLRKLSSNEFRDIIGSFASGVTIITARHQGKPKGTTASAVSSLSLEPPMVLICLNKTSSTGVAVSEAGRFAVNILGEGQAQEAMRFASKAEDKFAGVTWDEGNNGEPLLADALSTLECRVVEEVTGGTHTVFLAEVEHASARAGAPLAYFRGQFGRLELKQDEEALAEVRARVLARDIEVGVPLGLDDLATRLGLERGPVYHALTRLVGDGLVNRDAKGAFVVTPLTKDSVTQAWRARCSIELGTAAQTVGKVSDEKIAGLKALADAAEPPDDFSMSTWVNSYIAFHEGQVALADSESLVDAYHRVNAPAMILSVTQRNMEQAGQDREQAVAAHAHMNEVVAGYVAGDLDGVVDAIVRHEELARAVAETFMDSAGGSI